MNSKNAAAIIEIDICLERMPFETGQERLWAAKQRALLEVREDLELRALWDAQLL